MTDYMPTMHFFLYGAALQLLEINSDLPDDTSLTPRELAERLYVTHRWLRARRQQGNGPLCTVHEERQPGYSNRWRSRFTYRWRDVKAWLHQRAQHDGRKVNSGKIYKARPLTPREECK